MGKSETTSTQKSECIKKIRQRENKMVEEEVDVEYISLHGYIRNTPSDTEVQAEHQLRQAGGPDQRKRIYRPTQNSVGQRN